MAVRETTPIHVVSIYSLQGLEQPNLLGCFPSFIPLGKKPQVSDFKAGILTLYFYPILKKPLAIYHESLILGYFWRLETW
jgi:hypothetical protein